MEPRPSPTITAFTGRDETSIDGKGRVAFSKKFRDKLGEDFLFGLNHYGCLIATSRAEFEKMYAEIDAAPRLSTGRAIYSEEFLSTFEDDNNFDKTGRVVIPQSLRVAAKLTGDVILVGAGDTVQVWDKGEYEIYRADRNAYNFDRQETLRKAYDDMKEGR